MRQVIAVVEKDDDPPLLTIAAALADLLDAEPVVISLSGDDSASRLGRVRDAVQDQHVVAVAMRADEPESLCWRVVTDASVPVLVVPDGASRLAPRISRVLVPLDGAAETAASVRDVVVRATRAGAAVVAVHVFTEDNVPPFWDQAAHTHQTWTREFGERNLPGIELDLRRGRPADEVLTEAQHEGVDLIVLAWSQNLRGGRARTVRHAITDGTVPVLLIGMSEDLRARPQDLVPS